MQDFGSLVQREFDPQVGQNCNDNASLERADRKIKGLEKKYNDKA